MVSTINLFISLITCVVFLIIFMISTNGLTVISKLTVVFDSASTVSDRSYESSLSVALLSRSLEIRTYHERVILYIIMRYDSEDCY